MRVDNQSTRRKRGEITQAQAQKLLEAAQAASAWLDEHMSACATQPTWLSGAPAQGLCDCLVGDLRAAIHEITGE